MEWEAIVNKNANDNAKKYNERHTRRKLYLSRALISAAVALAFILTTLGKLVHPVLGESGMVFAICIAWYNLGRAKGSATNVF